MELTRILRLLWVRRPLLVVGLFLALVASVVGSYHLSLTKFKLTPKTTSFGSASTQVFVDSARSSIATLAGNPQPLSSRSSLLAQFLASAEVRAEIDKKMGLPPNSIPVISSPNTVQAAQDNLFSAADQVASGGTQGTYSITFQPQLELPIIDIYTRGPDAAGAIKLADVAAQSLSEQIQKLGDTSGVPRDSPSRIVMREIGPATGGQVASHIAAIRLILTFLGVFLVWCIAVVFFTWLKADWQRTAALAEHEPA